MTILDKILAEKEKEVSLLLNQTFDQVSFNRPTTFKEKVAASDKINVISEIKRSSPSKGEINMGVNPVEQAKKYEASGAAAISILTDKPFFNGSMDDLRAIRQAVDLPILCKDFMIDPVQIDQAKASGATIILLIVAALSDENFKKLYRYALSQDLEVLCEVHNEEEMERALEVNPEIIGINNRNLKTFEVDLMTTNNLASMVTNPNTILVSESGIKTKQDVIRVSEAGADAILVGETLMRADNLTETFQDLKVPTPEKGVR
ncbi:indole-3-glycerol phosphate synthase [Virgibacillus natechei]|uniref:Indole-3-glycerol phosphate synthase n=1 Tax=Virgibacillus natechei TaxID=1216297 RepID=A0ABS4ICA7_9BACI|nr:indole-3-glycerol phosphate synthase TrpC [Virgibacillus natechei]MBP1968483.1 indole-3-glycerol phosphate synthase [Virgibacillus natechei]UZD13601.1 indole-3-glycerol phosphate synthase TrpC [Virgibacillus natechei]